MVTEDDGGKGLKEVDSLELTILVDNYTDILMMQGSEVVRRPMTPPPNVPWAEHGFSCLLRTRIGDETHDVLMDAGVTGQCLPHNAAVLRQDLTKVEAIVLSHGHADHFGGLSEFIRSSGRRIPLYLHPDAFLERRLVLPGIGPSALFNLNEASITKDGADVVGRREASTVANGMVLVSGQVERTTSFERGFPMAEARIDGKWVVDPFLDDQGVAVKVKGKGLVVVSGCAHSGIINTVRHLNKKAEANEVLAVLGGFHLTGPLFDSIITPTIEQMKALAPTLVVPTHCTGWKAIGQFAKEMPGQFVLNTVGTTYSFN